MVSSLLFDFSITSTLLFVAYLLRRKVRIFQRLFLPAPLIAGVIGILLGPHVLGQFSPIYLQYSEYIGQCALPLLCCLFSTQLFMMKLNVEDAKKAFHSYALTGVVIFVQVLIGIILVRLIMPGAHDAYGLMPFTSYLGGPGVCTVVTNIVGDLENFSVETANSIGNTYATVSMLTGVTIGMILINLARRKGILTKTGNMNDIPKSEFTGFVEPADRVSAANDVTNSNSLNTMTLQFCIAGVIIFVGTVIHKLITKVPSLSGIAITVPVIVTGLLMTFVFRALHLENVVDPKSIKHFSTIALELLITSTIANTNILIFTTHGLLMVVTSLLIIASNVIVVFGLGRLWNKHCWFENSVGVFGCANGVFATGLLLLRTADPDDASDSLAPFCTASAMTMISTQFVYLNFVPMWIKSNNNAVFLGTAVALVVFLLLGFVVSGKKKG